MAEVVEQSLPTPEIRGSNLDIGQILFTNCTIEKMEMKKKTPRIAIYKKEFYNSTLSGIFTIAF